MGQTGEDALVLALLEITLGQIIEAVVVAVGTIAVACLVKEVIDIIPWDSLFGRNEQVVTIDPVAGYFQGIECAKSDANSKNESDSESQSGDATNSKNKKGVGGRMAR